MAERRDRAHDRQVPTISTVWLTSTNPLSSATARAQRSTAGPSTSTVATAAAAHQVVVVPGAAPAIGHLAVSAAQHVDLAGVGQDLQVPVHGREPDALTSVPEQVVHLLRAAEAVHLVEDRGHRRALTGGADRWPGPGDRHLPSSCVDVRNEIGFHLTSGRDGWRGGRCARAQQVGGRRGGGRAGARRVRDRARARIARGGAGPADPGRRSGELLGQHRRAGRRLARAGDQPGRQPGRGPARLRAHPRRRARSRHRGPGPGQRDRLRHVGDQARRGRRRRPARPWCRSATVVGAKDGDNPHRWYDPVGRGPGRGSDLGAAYGRIDPAATTDFRDLRTHFRTTATASYRDVVDQIRSRYAGTAVGASESIVAMLTPALGLDLVTPPGFLRAVSEGTDPTAGDKTTVDEQIATHADRRLRLQQPERHARRAGPGQRGARRRHPGDHDHRDHGPRRRHLAAVADGAAPAAARGARDGDRGVTR